MVTILPRSNLVTNIGVGTDSTHMHREDPTKHYQKIYPMSFPLSHPAILSPCHAADEHSQKHHFGEAKLKNPGARLRRLISKLRVPPSI
jgi:hypothetical protein